MLLELLYKIGVPFRCFPFEYILLGKRRQKVTDFATGKLIVEFPVILLGNGFGICRAVERGKDKMLLFIESIIFLFYGVFTNIGNDTVDLLCFENQIRS